MSCQLSLGSQVSLKIVSVNKQGQSLPPLKRPSLYSKLRRNLVSKKPVDSMMGVGSFVVQAMEAAIVT